MHMNVQVKLDSTVMKLRKAFEYYLYVAFYHD